MNTYALILLGAAAMIGLIAFVVDAVTVRRYRALRTRCLVRQLGDRVSQLEVDLRHAEAERDDISAELDEAYTAAAATARDRRCLIEDVEHVRRALTETRRVFGDGDAWFHASTADRAREVVAERDRLRAADPFAMVRAFHVKFGQVDAVTPDIDHCRELRLRLIDEEFRELRDALDANDIVAVADALADLTYVVIGSGLQWGIPLDRVFAEVHRSNMTKQGGGKRADGKILKGPAYEPPDVAAALYGCSSLDAFFDAELYPDEADAFRVHLATCERCQRVLHGRMQEQVAAGRSRCDDRIAFVDGELSEDHATAFRAHLRDCEACRKALPEDAQLAARLSTLDPEVRR